jgi:dihydropteroate synthase
MSSKDKDNGPMFTLNCRGRILPANRPLVMGIINTTPDSFYQGSRFMGAEEVLQQAGKMIEEGADILDIGGQSSRPGAQVVGMEEELRRVITPIKLLHTHFPGTVISVDTFHSIVAREAVAAGASMVNDIGGGTLDNDMLATVGRLGVPYICMHMKGTPATMNREAVYEDVTREVLDFFIRRIDDCREAGIHDLILDPGLGFAKNGIHNLVLLKNLAALGIPGRPLLLGLSRKSFIYKALGTTSEQALNGTSILNTLALLNGAAILRVHDPREASEAIRLLELYKMENSR